jgi:hypothetical protein
MLMCLLAWNPSWGREPRPEPRYSARLVRVEAIIERTLTSTPIPLSPEVKSFLVPGWGQWAQKRRVPAVLFAALEAGAITTAVVYAVRGSHAYQRYQDATTEEDAVRWREETMRLDRARNVSIVASAAVWGLNVLDAALAERRAHRRKPPAPPP